MISWPVDDLGVLNLSTGVKRKVTTPVGGLGNWGASGDFAVLWRNPEQWKIHSSVRRFPQIIGALCINPQGHDWLLKVNPVWRFQVGMKGTIFFSPIGRPKNLNIRNTIRWSNLCHHGFKVPTAVLVGFESLGLAGFVHLTIAWGHDPRWFSTHFSMGPMQQIFGSLRYPPFQIKQIMAGWVGV